MCIRDSTPMRPGVWNVDVLQQRETLDVLCFAQRWLMRHGPRRDQDDFATGDVVGYGAGPAPIAKQNGTVKVRALEVVALRIGNKVQCYMRICALELRQTGDQPFGAKSRQRRQMQGAATIFPRD